MQIFSRMLWAIVSLISALGIAFAVLALIDPAGSKLSDDGDPFGMPASAVEVWLQLLFYVTLLFTGLWMCCRKAKKMSKTTLPKVKETASYPHPPAN